MPRNGGRKEESTASHAQVFLLIETTANLSNQNVPLWSLLNGNSVAYRMEHT